MSQSTPRSFQSLALLGTLALSVMLWPLAASADELGPDEADAIVRAQWFEGIPEEVLAPLSEAAVLRLAGILEDPLQASQHAAALEVLGRAGGPGAFEIILGYGREAPTGEAVSGVHRAQLTVPLALGHLAREDDRALAELLRRARHREAAPWRHRHFDHARVGRLLHRMTLTGLGLSGRTQSRVALEAFARGERSPRTRRSRLDVASTRDSRLRVHALDMLELHARSRATREEHSR